MIQFLKAYTHKHKHGNRRIVMGQKCTFRPEIEAELIKKGIARATTWNGKKEKLKTDFFKPKE